PAEGGDREMAGDPPADHHSRRADQGNRCRLQGRRSWADRRAGPGRDVGDSGDLRAARDPGRGRPRGGDEQGAHRAGAGAGRARCTRHRHRRRRRRAGRGALVTSPIHRRELVLVAILGVMVVAITLRAPVFASAASLDTLVTDGGILAMMALVQMLALITDGIDLSIAANMALVGMVTALASRAH